MSGTLGEGLTPFLSTSMWKGLGLDHEGLLLLISAALMEMVIATRLEGLYCTAPAQVVQ